jgi:hypothetical protein
MKARIQNGIIVEFLKAVEGFQIYECFHPDILAQCIDIPEGAQVGWVQQEDGSWAAPPVEPTPEVAP